MDQGVIRPGKQPDADLGVIVPEPLDARRKMMGYQIWVGADNERTPPLCVVHLRLEGVYGGDHRSHQLQKSESFRGQLNGTLDAVKEGDTELIFQFPKVRRHRRLP